MLTTWFFCDIFPENQNQQNMELIHFILALMGATILFLLRSRSQKTRIINQLLPLQKEKSARSLMSAHIQQMVTVMKKPGARKRMDELITKQDRLGKMTTLFTDTAEAWEQVEEVYLMFYEFLFDEDFRKMRTDEGLEGLTALKTIHLDVVGYIERNPGFKEKCMHILGRNIKLATDYAELEQLQQVAKTWEPFTLWQNEVDSLFQTKAAELCKKDMEISRMALSQRLTISAWGKQELKEVRGIFLQGVEIIKRGLLSSEDSQKIALGYRDTAKAAIDNFAKWAQGENVDMLSEVKNIYNSVAWPVHNLVH